MTYQQSSIYNILEKQEPHYLLKGYVTDVFDEQLGRFYAYTFNKLNPEDHEVAATLDLYSADGKGSWGADQERSKIYVDDGCAYRMKPADQCIKEGVYHAYTVRFFGCLYEGWWYISKGFTERIRVARYEEFAAFMPLYSNDFTMIFPITREYMLIPALVKNNQNVYRLCYFFWHAEDRKIYEWTYFKPEAFGSSHHYAFDIIENLSQISGWNDHSYLNSSCTLDDKHFWDTYVLLKNEDGRYRYLNELLS